MAMPRPEAGKAGTTHVSFVCQRCRQPLKLDSSFQSLDQKVLTELTAPLACTLESEEADRLIREKVVDFEYEEDGNLVRKIIGPTDEVESSQDFTLLGETGPGSMENLSHRLKVTSYLFDIMSGQSEVDHPLCEECTDNLLDQLDHQLKVTEDECKDYRDFLEKLGTSGDEVDEKALDNELKQLQAEEETLKQQLSSVEKEREELVELMQNERKNTEELEQQEAKYRKDYNEYKRQALELEDEQRSVDNQLRYAQAQLDKLKKTNVFNATFHIWHSGHFGTINNFRLGRLPSVPVDWNEINAAWGQTVLLLHSLARKMNLTFQRFRLVPYGNHSYLESLSDKSKELPLYGSGGFRFFWDTKFDQAMVAFLDCLQQFKEEVERGDTGFCLPYRMENGKIEDSSTGNSYSIKIQFNSEEQWTKALKFMLTNLKWGLAWVSSQFANK
ncbi:beclin-1-like [Haliotis rufescens]|uniref:Beclin-1 n=1 Tax=Haliotis discus discus TaxID=91233 RepID=A0A8R9Z4X0_HALDI|nr:beclin-1-like [Haliotis rufescens]AYP63836.1 beclin-1 [Haliotis discus discus]UUJ75035.1 beclin 1 [Haliotis discus hannai]